MTSVDDHEIAYLHMGVLCESYEGSGMTHSTALELYDGLLGGLINERGLDEDEVFSGAADAIRDRGLEDVFLGDVP